MTMSLIGKFQYLSRKAFGTNGRKRRRRELTELLQSGLFDPIWYLESYTDVRESGVDPARHYLESGWREGRDPSPHFCTTAYLRANADVAAQDVNPLLHYIQHGQSEGRGAPDLVAPVRALVDVVGQFGPAAPCAHFPLPEQNITRWLRAARISKGPKSIEIGGMVVATGADDAEATNARSAIALLGWLAGEVETQFEVAAFAQGDRASLVDAWDAGAGIFRTRWATLGNGPVVVRAIQQAGEEPELIGEGCVGRELDFVDAMPRNPFFPILFLFTDVEGSFLGYRFLTFPSLFRGGVHYAELVALAEQGDGMGEFDIAEVDERLARQLIGLRLGEQAPLISKLVIALEGADGTEAIFHADLREWVARIMRVSLVLEADASGTGSFLDPRLTVVPESPRPDGKAELTIGHDMVPAISILCAGAGRGELADEVLGSFIVASDDPSVPATLVRVPPNARLLDMAGQLTSFPTIGPLTRSARLPADPGFVAIRKAAGAPSEAELLVPSASSDLASQSAETPISCVIWPSDWDHTQLLQAIESLALQTAAPQTIVFVGEPPEIVHSAAARYFAEGLKVALDNADAADHLTSGITVYLGPGIVLHDNRTISVLAPMLLSAGTRSVCAPVVFAESRGKGWVVTQADASAIDIRLFRKAAIPVGQPSRDFWIAPAESVREWLRGSISDLQNGVHLYSTLVSVSTLDRRRSGEPRVAVPESGFAVSTELVVG